MLLNSVKAVGAILAVGGTGATVTTFFLSNNSNYSMDYNIFGTEAIGHQLLCSREGERFEYPTLEATTDNSASIKCSYIDSQTGPKEELREPETKGYKDKEVNKLSCKLSKYNEYQCTHPDKKVTLELKNEGKEVSVLLQLQG
ncbi:hypothetical protein MHLP_01630 [Candidatus Mycoplasma haematolamae str. Purdue]|uniref:Uncharacterized protein n=1 Tax=Mycoplasma haematolamae (strain Purdue) TaxID=1212765 RepID=I7CF82_MYCHA|nr:hypothetical protein [Candidatus Mycoplasma haematolamae]AFO51906.1 hypothetical protein MHLP_01630 [Candidatus Mycoplasma haematolamae str. Purdue]